MLSELRVEELGVIAALEVLLGPGLTALTGETGAGKTLVVEAVELLLGGRGDPTMVRAGAAEAVVEGRFVGAFPEGDAGRAEEDGARDGEGEGELVLRRVLPASGRTRAYVDGRGVPLASLEERGRGLVDLHGQHAHQSLLRPASQRAALDRFAGVDLSRLAGLRRELGALEARLAGLGGDERERRREVDLLRFELEEIAAARIVSADEEEGLEAREEALANAAALRAAVVAAMAALGGAGGGAGEAPLGGSDEGGAEGLVGAAIAALGRHGLLAEHAGRLRAVQGELEDALHGLRLVGEAVEEDPEALAAVRARRQLLRGLVRKHGEALADVLAAATSHEARIAELEGQDEARAGLEAERATLLAAIAKEESAIGDARRAAAPGLAAEVERHLGQLALGRARLAVRLAEDGLGDDVEVLLGANPGEPLAPLARVASGGELARTMLALRLVLSAGPPTLVFDEVDAGIGGAAAVAVGQALASLSGDHQVLVVTHLAQVAARADAHLVVEKAERAGRTVTELKRVEGDERVAELSRMLAGDAASAAGRRHAAELLAAARRERRAGGAGRPRETVRAARRRAL